MWCTGTNPMLPRETAEPGNTTAHTSPLSELN